VKACNDEGIWNKTPAFYSFVITPPFWQAWWFYLSVILVGIGSIYAFVKARDFETFEQRRKTHTGKYSQKNYERPNAGFC